MELKIKVCGMKYSENILAIAKHSPDYLGFIFYEKSKRYVGKDFDTKVLNQLPSSINKVGVFVNESVQSVFENIKKYSLDVVQLHGDESVEYCSVLGASGIEIIKVFQIDKAFDFNLIEPYKKHVDYFLFDTKSEGYGGTGKKYDWSLLKNYDNEIPFFLSGGISLEDAEELKKMTQLNIHALDINSKFEISPGLKDMERVKSFIDKIRNEVRSKRKRILR